MKITSTQEGEVHRFNRWIALSLLALLFALPLQANAATLSDADYKATMTSLDEVEKLVNSTIDKLQRDMSMEEASATLPHLQERLQWMRATKVAAARIDTSHTLRSHSTDSQRARCIIMRAGLMDEAFQDVMVNVSMKAHGAANSLLLPMSPAPNTAQSCR